MRFLGELSQARNDGIDTYLLTYLLTWMGPVVRLRLEHGYSRELPPRHAEMRQGNGERPDWAREFGSGNSGDEGERRATGWRDRVREAAVRAEREARLARAEEATEAREERVARAAAEDLEQRQPPPASACCRTSSLITH